MRIAKLKSAYNLLIIGPRAKLKSVYKEFTIDPRGLQCETNLQDITDWEYSDVRFDLWPLLEGQTMVHLLWSVVFLVGTNLHRFFDV